MKGAAEDLGASGRLTSGFYARSTHARNGLYRSLRHPILMRTALVVASKHENLEDPTVSPFSGYEYISRTFSSGFHSVPAWHAGGSLMSCSARDDRAETVRGALPHSVTSGARVFVFS